MGGRTAFGDHKIGTTIVIKIQDGCAALFTIDLDSILLAREWRERTLPISAQKQSTAGVHPWNARSRGEKILSQKKIVATIQFEISNRQAEHSGDLCFTR